MSHPETPPAARPFAVPPAPCSHCGAVRVLRPRRLCCRCYHNPAISDRVPKGDYSTPDAVPDGNGPRKLGEPTDEWPGSEGKIAAMRDRAAAGLAIFHPQDRRQE